MSINTISDAIKALAQSLQLATVFPSGLLVLLNAYVILPQFFQVGDVSTPTGATILIASTLMLSYMLYAFNFPLIRLLEGYKLSWLDASQWRLERKQQQYRNLRNEIKKAADDLDSMKNALGFDPDKDKTNEISEENSERWQSLKLQQAQKERELDHHFPSMLGAVLPTRLGNVIAAFEDYSYTRYGMDSIALWPRLIPVLKDTQYIDFVAQEKSVFDFLLNLLGVVTVLGLEFIYLGAFRADLVWIGLTLLITGVLVFVLYNGLIIAARQWGTTVRVAFDLHRHDLRRRLGLKAASDFEEEYRRWQSLSTFLLCRSDEIWFKEFLSQKDFDAMPK